MTEHGIHYKLRVVTLTHNHDDTPHTIFNTINVTFWKKSEVIDFDLKNQNSDLPAYFSVLNCDFSQFIKIRLLIKTTKTGFCEYLRIYYLCFHESEISELYINLFVLKFSFC